MTFAELSVTLIAQTRLELVYAEPDVEGFVNVDYAIEKWLPFADDDSPTSADALAEFAGRGCYRAFNRPNPATAENEPYLKHIIDVGHESVFGHASASFQVEGVSRSLTHELVRHRFLVFSQQSQRFVDESDCDFVLPPLLSDPEHEDLRDAVERELLLARKAYAELAQALTERGVSRKQAREAARALLPEATETRLVVSGNLRAWRDFLKLRLNPAADAEIRRFAEAVLGELRTKVAPATFQDFV